MKTESVRGSDAIAAYVAEIARIYGAGMATEHSYRSAIMKLVGALTPNLVATNEPKRIECGSPDIILTEKDVPVGYIETKAPFDDDLEGRAANKEQFDRYLASLDKIVFTDFLRFRFYEHGEFKSEIVLGRMSNEVRKKWKAGESFLSDDIVPDAGAFELFATTFASWCAKPVQSIKRAGELSRMMAGKARQIAYVIEHALARDLAESGGSRSRATETDAQERVPPCATAVGRVYINTEQYFGEVTERSWNFFIGGYQPAQKWLKDRKGRRLSPSDVVYYARILRALDLTAEIMAEIDGARKFTSTDS